MCSAVGERLNPGIRSGTLATVVSTASDSRTVGDTPGVLEILDEHRALRWATEDAGRVKGRQDRPPNRRERRTVGLQHSEPPPPGHCPDGRQTERHDDGPRVGFDVAHESSPTRIDGVTHGWTGCGTQATALVMKRSPGVSPASASASDSTRPAGPTNGRPALISSRPGASPTRTMRLAGSPRGPTAGPNSQYGQPGSGRWSARCQRSAPPARNSTERATLVC